MPEPEEESGFRLFPYTELLYPVGSSGLYIGAGEFSAGYYKLTPDNVLDVANQTGKASALSIDFYACTAEGLTKAKVSGKYGVVSMGVGVTNVGERAAFDVLIDLTMNDDGTIAATVGSKVAMTQVDQQEESGFSIDFNSDNDPVPANGYYTLSDDGGFEGEFMVNDAVTYTIDGFFPNQGKIIVGRGIQSGQMEGKEVSFQFPGIGVCLPGDEETVALAGRQYWFMGQLFSFTPGGKTRTGQFCGGEVHFHNQGSCTLVNGLNVIEREDDSSNYTGESIPFGASGTYVSGPGGRFTMSWQNNDGKTASVEGYISYDGTVIISSAAWSSENDSGSMWFIGGEIEQEYGSQLPAAPWQVPGYQATYRRYEEGNPGGAWEVTGKNLGMVLVGGQSYVMWERYNYENENDTITMSIRKDFLSQHSIGPIGEFSYESEDDGEEKWVNRYIWEGPEDITLPGGTFCTYKRTGMAAEYIDGLPFEDHLFLQTQKWIDWFHPDYLLVKEIDYWTDDRPALIQELINSTVIRQ